LVAESVFGQQSALADGLGLEPLAVNFTSPFYQGFDAGLEITADEISYADVLTGQNASLELVMIDGSVDLNDVAFSTLGGKFFGGAQIKNTQGTVLANLRYAFSDIDAREAMRTLKIQNVTSGKLSLQGSSEASGKSLEALITNLSGDGLVAVENINLTGFDASGFDAILLETGVDEYEIATEKIQALIVENLLVSATKIAKLDAPYSLTRGRMRVRNVNQSTDDAELTGSLEIDLTDRSLQADMNVLFDPGKREIIQGADPQIELSWSGPVGNLELEIDTDRLESYLSLRAFEESQRRIETLEAQVIEKQRLQQQIALSFAIEQYQNRKREEQIEQNSLNESLRFNNASRLSTEAAKQRKEQARRLEEEAKRRAEAARLKAEEEKRLADELKARQAAEEKARIERERERKIRAAAEKAAKAKAKRQAEARPEDVPIGVQQLLQENIIKNLENFLGGN